VIFTFGFCHECSCGRSLRSCYVELEGDYDGARERMAELYGRKWAFQYESEEAAGVAKYDLRRVAPDAECECGGLGRAPWEPEHAETD
jgi:hypothetical protein